MKFAALLISTLLAVSHAEPPRSSYLPPQARNNFGSNQFGSGSPSSQYGAPNSFSSQPRTNYGPPSSNSGRTNYAPPQPNSQYGAPSQQLNSQYAAPAQQPNSQYGAPSQQSYSQQSYDLPVDQDYGNNFQQSAPSPSYGAPSSSRNGYNDNAQQGGYEEPAKYEFQYDVQDEAAGLDFGHKEKRDGSVATGKYYVLLPDGRKQIVNYIADENGYRPTITYEETGRGGYDNNAQQQGYDNNAQQGGYRGY